MTLHGTLVATGTLTLALLTVGVPATARAQAQPAPFVREIKLGVLVHDMPGLWSGFRLEHGVGMNGEVIFSPSVALLGGHLRPAVGGTYAIATRDGGTTSKAYADVRWMFEARNGLFLSLGIGAAVHDGVLGPGSPGRGDLDRKWLGRRILFHIPLEVGYQLTSHTSVSVYFDHISNGYTKAHNEGLDTLGVRYGYRF